MAIPNFVQPHRAAVEDTQLARIAQTSQQADKLRREIEELETRLSEAQRQLDETIMNALPDLLDEAGVSKVEFQRDGYGYKVLAKPYYHASIAANWPPEKRSYAFNYLQDIGMGDLIKTEVTVAFPRENREQAMQFADDLRQRGVPCSVNETVHWSTLTAWLKEQVEQRQFVPDLDAIGGVVGRKAQVKIEEIKW